MSGPPQGNKTPINLKLSIGGRPLEAVVDVPAKAVRSVDLLPILQAMDDAVIDVAAETVRQQGKTITCRAGCGACCRQLVPITETDAHYLCELIAEMPPERRRQVERRFDDALDALDRAGMLDRLLGAAEIADRDRRRQLGLDYFELKVPCPLLQDESCSVHLHRPMVCREYLVTTPAANCSAPLPQRIEKVQIPVTLSKLLSRFGDGKGERPARWLPLVLALRWVAERRGSDDPEVELSTLPGAEMFENFVNLVSSHE